MKVPRTLSWPDRRTGIALVQQGGEGQVLGGGPVEALARLDGFAAAGDHPLDGLVDVDPLGDAR